MCGVIGHSDKDCCNVDDDVEQEKVMGWSKSLQATPRKGVQKLMEELEEVRSCRRVLFVTKAEVEGGSNTHSWKKDNGVGQGGVRYEGLSCEG